jgi:hypothetical protein
LRRRADQRPLATHAPCQLSDGNLGFLRQMSYVAVMARTFVRVELLEQDDGPLSPFSVEMARAGFQQTVKGRKTRRALRLPRGMYFIEETTPSEALELTREAARHACVKARIFCMPVSNDIRFGNLQNVGAALES